MKGTRPEPYFSPPGFPDPSREPGFGAPPLREWLWVGIPTWLTHPWLSVQIRVSKESASGLAHSMTLACIPGWWTSLCAKRRSFGPRTKEAISVDVDELIEVQQRPGQFRFAAILRQAQRSHQLRIVRLPQ